MSKQYRHVVVALSMIFVTSTLTVGCTTKNSSNTSSNSHGAASQSNAIVAANGDGKMIKAVGAENEYANVIKQIGGKYVSVTAIMDNPSTDPHDYEASTRDAELIGAATLIVQNGLGYDEFMNTLESSTPKTHQTVITVAKALGYGTNTKNPHLWYQPQTMPKVAELIARALSKEDPSEQQYFQNNLRKFENSLDKWTQAMASLKEKYGDSGVAVTEPVADYLLQASGMKVETPWSFQAAIMNGVSPSPQDIAKQEELFNDRKVRVFLYNQQAITSVTKKFLSLAKADDIPVIGVYETMPPKYDYQTWMEAETKALREALQDGKSTEIFA